MQNALPRRFWPVLLASAIGMVALLLWWLESGPPPQVPEPGPAEAVQPESPPATGTVAGFGAARPAPPVAAVEQARAGQLTSEQAHRVADWIRQLDAAADVAARDEVLEDARSHEDTEVLVELVLHQLARVGPEERIEALQKLVGNSGESQIKAFVRGLDDAERDVREAALQFVRDQEPAVRVPVFEYGLGSNDASVRADSFLELTRENVKAAIPALMRALDLADPGISEQAANELLLRLSDTRSQPFTGAAEALSWWDANGRRYDDRMYRID